MITKLSGKISTRLIWLTLFRDLLRHIYMLLLFPISDLCHRFTVWKNNLLIPSLILFWASNCLLLPNQSFPWNNVLKKMLLEMQRQSDYSSLQFLLNKIHKEKNEEACPKIEIANKRFIFWLFEIVFVKECVCVCGCVQ